MNPVYHFCWRFTQLTLESLFGYEGYGDQHLPRRGGFLVAANHASFLDPPTIGACVPFAMHFFARSSLFRGPFASLLPRLNSIPVNRDGDSDVRSIRMALTVLRDGGGLLIFPEGTRSPDGTLQEGKRGVGMLACRAAVPVVPCRIFGSHKALNREAATPKLRTPLTVVFHPPVPPASYDPGKTHPERYDEAARRIMAAIAAIAPPPEGEAV